MSRVWLLACCLFLGAGCRHEGAARQVYFPTAIVVAEDVTAAVEIEKELAKRYEVFAPEG